MKRIRKTRDEYQIHQFFPGSGWEEITAADTRKEAREDLKAYRVNQPEYPVKMIKKRVKAQAA